MKQQVVFHPYQFSGSVQSELALLKNKPAEYWEDIGEKMALSLFTYTSKEVPAYQKHLSAKNRDASSVQTLADFQQVPTITKESYLRASVYEELFPTGGIQLATTISATSGSTGKPFFFPRAEEHDACYAYAAEVFLNNQFSLAEKKTLGIIGFAFGIWIGGVFTYKNFNTLAQKGYPLTLIPVGTNKELFLTSFEKFASEYDQVILMGYPPFIKEVLETGVERGIEWGRYSLRILTAAEGYSEDFKNHIAKLAGIHNVVNDIITIYGTVEQGTIAHETATASLIRRLAGVTPAVFQSLFPRATNMPTLAQYFPHTVYFEEVDGELAVTSYGSSIPLVRYRFADLGGVIPYNQMLHTLGALGIDLLEEAKKWGVEEKILRLPFVYVYARSDFVITFRGANIYPGEIREALDAPEFAPFITGKFTLVSDENAQHDKEMVVNIELQPQVEPTTALADTLQLAIITTLCAKNSEFNNEYTSNSAKATPKVVLCSFADERYFSGGGKQQWVRKKNN